MTEATPRPWSWESGVGDYYIIHDTLEEPRTIALCGEIEHSNSGDIPSKQYQANAELIVHSVNAHDDLMGALRAVEWGAGFCPYCGRRGPRLDMKDVSHTDDCQLDAAIVKGEAK